MHKFFEVTGAIVWLLIALALVWLIAGLFYQKVWQVYKFRTWVYQVWEYIVLRRRFKQWKARGYSDLNLEIAKLQKAKLEGKVKGMEYRKRNLFKKQIMAMFDEYISSEAARLEQVKIDSYKNQ